MPMGTMPIRKDHKETQTYPNGVNVMTIEDVIAL